MLLSLLPLKKKKKSKIEFEKRIAKPNSFANKRKPCRGRNSLRNKTWVFVVSFSGVRRWKPQREIPSPPAMGLEPAHPS